MKSKLAKILGVACYLVVLGLLFRLDWGALFKPKQILLVVFGMLILTASQYKRGISKEDVLAGLRWNAILAGFLTTLISVLSSTNASLADIGTLQFSEHLLPLLYGSVLYLLIGVALDGNPEKRADNYNPSIIELTDTQTAERVFRSFLLTKRECHVAQKMLQNMSNKEIAADLYISEATVKKHVQNIYHKAGAISRENFMDIYVASASGERHREMK